MSQIQIKRIYEPADESDGFRILVDRLWPRGVKKESAHLDVWLKEAGPSNELRKWFNHDPEKWEAFKKKYRDELKKSAAAKELIDLVAKHKNTTLLYSAHDEEHNQAQVLLQFLKGKAD